MRSELRLWGAVVMTMMIVIDTGAVALVRALQCQGLRSVLLRCFPYASCPRDSSWQSHTLLGNQGSDEWLFPR